MSENQIPEPGWPQWADTPAGRERNQQDQARRNERIREAAQAAQWAANPDNACAANGVTADGRSYHYSSAHNGYVFDDEPGPV